MGFDTEEDLILLSVLTEKELIETRRIASLRSHVEQAMERIKNFHIFDCT